MLQRIFLTALATILAGSALASAEVADLACIQTAPAQYNLSYSFTGGSHEVTIFASTDPAGNKGLEPVLKTSATNVTVHAGAPGERVYFFLKPDDGRQREVSIRHLPLEGSPNFRDLGGYETIDGRSVRWGAIYRSGALNALTAQDFAYLSNLGIRAVCDFRTARENATAPELWVPGAEVEHIALPIPPRVNKDAMTTPQEFYASNPTLAELKEWMAINYDSLAFTSVAQYCKLFARLDQDRLPLLYHCGSGKDRTGVFSAFLLLMLGVPEKTVVADYELSNTFLQVPPPGSAHPAASSAAPAKHGQLTEEQWRVLMVSDPAYLQNLLRHIEARYGSFDNYRRAVLDVSDAKVERLRALLLQ